MMNKSDLEQRIAQIKLSQEQLKGQFSTLQGHLDEANFWLAKLDESLSNVVEEEPAQELGDDCAIEEGNESESDSE
jgi:predicted  nucleic acid-binding Zn-ribbon protein